MSERWGGSWGGSRGRGEDSPSPSEPNLPPFSSGNAVWGGRTEDRPDGSEGPDGGAIEGIGSPPSPSLPVTALSSGSSRSVSTPKVRSGRHQTSKSRPDAARRLVSLAVAAAYADVSTRTLRRYIAAGRLTGYRVGPRLLKVDLIEVDRLARPIPTARGPG